MAPLRTTTHWRRYFTFTNVLIASVVIRIVLIIYSEWHDAQPGVVVKYTDVDYCVFTDAARYVTRTSTKVLSPNIRAMEAYRTVEESFAKGPLGVYLRVGDPYDRDTYRYTPLLALIMVPNVLLFPSFGKCLFAACDILVGILIRRILARFVLSISHNPANSKEEPNVAASDYREHLATIYSSIHLLNPLVFSISTRGSSESIIGALVVTTLYFALSRRWDATGVMLGLATHWKVYPVIYGASLVAVLASHDSRDAAGRHNSLANIMSWAVRLVSKKTVRLFAVSAGTFMALNVAMYSIWGEPFLEHSFLYHLHRLDHRHNFSPTFLPIYLSYPPHSTHSTYTSYLSELGLLSPWSKILRSPIANFVPQMGASLGTGFLLMKEGKAERLPFVWFVQTAVFVTLNKVCTSQYFLWYLTLLPLLLPSLRLSRLSALSLLVVWPTAQALWLKTGYDLEFLGKNVYYELWRWSIAFLAVNIWAIGVIIVGYRNARCTA